MDENCEPNEPQAERDERPRNKLSLIERLNERRRRLEQELAGVNAAIKLVDPTNAAIYATLRAADRY